MNKYLVIYLLISGITIPAIAQTAGIQYEITEHILNNGLKILVLEKPSAPVASLQIWYNVGSVDETKGLKGIAHLFEHMMFRGSKNYGPQEHANLIQQAGGRWNAYTSDEMTVYWESVPTDKLELALKLEADRMESLTIDHNTLETERQVVMEEYRSRIDNDPFGSMAKDARGYLFPNHGYEFGPIGKMEDIKNFSVEDCRNFFDVYYVPANATIIVAGGVKAENVIKMVKKEFAHIPPGLPNNRKPLTIPNDYVKPYFKGKTQLPVPVTVVSFYTGGQKSRDGVVLKLIFESLCTGKSSRLWKKLVKEKKVLEHFVGIQDQGSDVGTIFFGGVHLPFMEKAVKKNILEEIEKIKAEGLSEDEFLKVKNKHQSKMIFQRYHSNRLASGLGYSQLIKGDYKRFYEMQYEIENITQQDIIRVANKYLIESNMRIIHFEPKQQMFIANIVGFIKSIFSF
ncbi:MAG: insulinase family protein [Anaerohalosphaeraceae bacterium]|nr:insulinase family protein [Anaerohalosphaeraceae bacterium]